MPDEAGRLDDRQPVAEADQDAHLHRGEQDLDQHQGGESRHEWPGAVGEPLHEHVVDEELGHRGDREAGDRRQHAHDDHGQDLGQHRP